MEPKYSAVADSEVGRGGGWRGNPKIVQWQIQRWVGVAGGGRTQR